MADIEGNGVGPGFGRCLHGKHRAQLVRLREESSGDSYRLTEVEPVRFQQVKYRSRDLSELHNLQVWKGARGSRIPEGSSLNSSGTRTRSLNGTKLILVSHVTHYHGSNAHSRLSKEYGPNHACGTKSASRSYVFVKRWVLLFSIFSVLAEGANSVITRPANHIILAAHAYARRTAYQRRKLGFLEVLIIRSFGASSPMHTHTRGKSLGAIWRWAGLRTLQLIVMRRGTASCTGPLTKLVQERDSGCPLRARGSYKEVMNLMQSRGFDHNAAGYRGRPPRSMTDNFLKRHGNLKRGYGAHSTTLKRERFHVTLGFVESNDGPISSWERSGGSPWVHLRKSVMTQVHIHLRVLVPMEHVSACPSLSPWVVVTLTRKTFGGTCSDNKLRFRTGFASLGDVYCQSDPFAECGIVGVNHSGSSSFGLEHTAWPVSGCVP
ncbi:hypothetical protein F5141DRAFT_1203534 [Pisolithus sp. B1]|nr:hypothetical protein F5141DRAFT_1203534 [Pisolithus sp. B1]